MTDKAGVPGLLGTPGPVTASEIGPMPTKFFAATLNAHCPGVGSGLSQLVVDDSAASENGPLLND